MAEQLLNGNDVLLYFDTTTPITTALNAVTPENFDLVACLTDNGFDGTTASLESASKCLAGGFSSSIPDKQSWTMSLNGEQLLATGLAGRLSAEEVQQLWIDKETFWALQYDQAKNSVVYGLVYISSFSKANAASAISTFSATLTGVGGVGTGTTLQPVPTP